MLIKTKTIQEFQTDPKKELPSNKNVAADVLPSSLSLTKVKSFRS